MLAVTLVPCCQELTAAVLLPEKELALVITNG